MISWITDKIAISDYLDARRAPKEIDCIFNLAAEVTNQYLDGKSYFRIPISDGEAFTDDMLSAAMDYLEEMNQKEKKVLVHCIAGISRSPSIVAGYLALKMNIPYDQAMTIVKFRRPIVDPNYSNLTTSSVKNYVERKQKSV